MKRITSILMAFAILLVGGCSSERVIKEDKDRDRPEKNSYLSEMQDDETVSYDTNSQYWLPVSYTSYNEDGSLKNEAYWEYDNEGFVTFMSYGGARCWSEIEVSGNNVIFTITKYEFINEDGQYEELSMNEIDFGNIEYKFDNNGTLIGKGDLDYSEREIEYKNSKILVWLDEEGDVLSEYNNSQKVYYYPDDSVYYYQTEDWDDLQDVENIGEAASVISTVWKDAVTNSDGTKTTNVYYENGQLAEVIVWRPVSRRAYIQKIAFDNDWLYGGTLALIFRLG